MEPISLLLTAISSVISSRIMEWFKNWTYLKEEEKTRLSGPLADAVAWVLAGAVALLSGYLAHYYGFLESTEIWKIIGASVVGSKVAYEVQLGVRNIKS